MSEEQAEGEMAAQGLPVFIDWLQRLPRAVLVGAAAVVVIGLIVGTALPFGLGWVDQKDLETLGYPGIFLATFLGTATVFIPVPGLTLAGQALVVAGPRDLDLNPFAVVVIAGAGMTLAESTAYLAGMIGRQVSEQHEGPVPGRIGVWLRAAAGGIDRLMARYGFATLLVLAGVPNPLFEFAGITAGAVRMNFWRFLLAVGIGKTARAILLVVVGNAVLDLFEF